VYVCMHACMYMYV